MTTSTDVTSLAFELMLHNFIVPTPPVIKQGPRRLRAPSVTASPAVLFEENNPEN
jgi:hypothetical protein